MSTISREPRHSVTGNAMSDASFVAQTLDRMERQRVPSVRIARQRIAERARIGVGTFTNIVLGRVKGVDAAIRDKLQGLLVRELEREIARLEHELAAARQIGSRLNGELVSEIDAHLSRARTLLNGSTQ